MSGWTKLFGTIITSSVWSEDDKTRIMWVTMLASADSTGFVSGSIPGMAAIARMSLEDAEKSIEALCKPDPYSRSKKHEGRRLIEVDGGWQIVNYIKYRQMRDPEKRRQQNREAQARFRHKQKVSENNQGVSNRKQAVRNSKQGSDTKESQLLPGQSVTNTQSKPRISQSKPKQRQIYIYPPYNPPKGDTSVDDQPQASLTKAKSSDNGKLFEQFWAIYPRKVGKQKARQTWERLHASAELAEKIIGGVQRYRETTQWQTEGGKFIPHPTTFLNQRRWEDKIEIEQLDSYRRFGTHPASAEEIEALKAQGVL